MPVTPAPIDTAQHLASHFILHLAKALHAHGYSAHRLEEVLGEVSARLGVEAQFFTTPTSIFAAFGPPDQQRTHLLRVQPGEPNLGHLSRLDAVDVRQADFGIGLGFGLVAEQRQQAR